MPLNLAMPATTVDHIVTGSWSKKAAEEAGKYARVHTAAKSDNKSLPTIEPQKFTPGCAYVHYCDNETIQVGSVCYYNCCSVFRYAERVGEYAVGSALWHSFLCMLLRLLDAECAQRCVQGRAQTHGAGAET